MFKSMRGNIPGGNFQRGNLMGRSFPDTFILKLQDRSPLKYLIVRCSSCLVQHSIVVYNIIFYSLIKL